MKTASAGTENKSDIQITVAEHDSNDVQITVKSVVKQQFGAAIHQTIYNVAEHMRMSGVQIVADDYGAPDFVIEARVEAALKRLRRG